MHKRSRKGPRVLKNCTIYLDYSVSLHIHSLKQAHQGTLKIHLTDHADSNWQICLYYPSLSTDSPNRKPYSSQ